MPCDPPPCTRTAPTCTLMCRLRAPEREPLTTFIQLLPSFWTELCWATHTVASSAASIPNLARVFRMFCWLLLLNSFLAIAPPACALANGYNGSHLLWPGAAARCAHCCRPVPVPADAKLQFLFPDWRPTSATQGSSPEPGHHP